ncbi:MAG: hypothetical protein AB7I38_06745 [Dehalococcoidia bacterium]
MSLPIEAALGRADVGWLAHAQVHGHLQVVGFAGLFVLGVATRLAPRFTSRPPHIASLRVACWLLVSGLLLRAVGQPLAEHALFAAVMLVGAALEAAGALVALASLFRTLQPWAPPRSPSAALLAASVCWLTLQAVLGLWWLRDLASEGQPVLPADRNALLLTAQTFGVLLSALAGVGLRSFPTFFGAPPPPSRYAWTFAAALQAGLLLWLVGLTLRLDGAEAWGVRLTSTGQLLLGFAVAAVALAVGWWRRGARLAPASRHFIWALRALAASLTLTGALLALTAARALVNGSEVAPATLDAIRHVFLLGVITLAIVVMGQLILPEFASERLVRPPARWRGVAFAVAIPLAAVVRGLVPLAGVSGEARYWSMAVGGILGLASVAVFTWLYLRARRSHRAYLTRVAAWRGREVPLA